MRKRRPSCSCLESHSQLATARPLLQGTVTASAKTHLLAKCKGQNCAMLHIARTHIMVSEPQRDYFFSPEMSWCSISLVYLSRFAMSTRGEFITSCNGCVVRFPCLSIYDTTRPWFDSISSVWSKKQTCTVLLLSRNKIACRVRNHVNRQCG